VLELAEADTERKQPAEILTGWLTQFHSLATVNGLASAARRRPPA
jgi:hypothetical protein